MIIYHLIILASWLVLIAYWALSAGRAKRSVGARWNWPWEIGLRLVILILVALALHTAAGHHIRHHLVNFNPTAGFVGAALCACGVILAVWARVCLGRNWGLPMADELGTELITAGPYSRIRHPIYAGFIVAMLGSAIGQSVSWAIPLLIAGPYFVYSARREERRMTEQFPLQYPKYMRRTNILIPYIL